MGNENDSRDSYNLRSKKRKLNDNSEQGTGVLIEPPFTGKRKNPIMHVPFEVLQNVFKFLSFQELS